jgi:hypothetical protein
LLNEQPQQARRLQSQIECGPEKLSQWDIACRRHAAANHGFGEDYGTSSTAAS